MFVFPQETFAFAHKILIFPQYICLCNFAKEHNIFCERTQSFSWRHNTFHERTKYFYKRTQCFLWKCNKRNCFKRKRRFLEGTQHLCKSMKMFYERLHCFLREFNTFAKECNIFVLRERMFFERLPSFSGERNTSARACKSTEILFFCPKNINSIQDYLYSEFHETIVAKQLYMKLPFYNRFIYCRNLY